MPFGGLLTLGVIGGEAASSAIGAHAAGLAAQQQINAEKQVQQEAGQNIGNANQTLQNFYNQNVSTLAPYTQLGTLGTSELSQFLAPGGAGTQGFGSFTPPNPNDVANTPEAQFAQAQGMKGIENSAAAKGTDLSGGTLKDLSTFNQGLSSQLYGQAYSDALNTYNTNFNTFNANNNNLYNRLMGITSVGQTGAGQQVGSANQTAAGTSANDVTLAQILANSLTGQGNAQAAGTVGTANAIDNGISGATNNLASIYTNLYSGNGTNASNSTQGAQRARGF